MAVNYVPNWARIILLVLTALSFLPQLRRIVVRRDSTGISLHYVLFNLFAATDEFTTYFFYIVGHNMESQVVVSDPPNLGDWLNFAQISLALFLFFIELVLCIFFAPSGTGQLKVISFYATFLLVTFVPVLVDAALTAAYPDDDGREFVSIMLFAVETSIVKPVATLCSIASFFVQKSRPEALSSAGLALQAPIFALVALSWLGRDYYNGSRGGLGDLREFFYWYRHVGWTFWDNIVFALVQLALFALAGGWQVLVAAWTTRLGRWSRQRGDVETAGNSPAAAAAEEQQPLLE